jgi:holo-[acyl-carrier protein] synthase
MYIHGIGCDMIETARVARLYKRFGDKLLARILTPQEFLQAQAQASVVPRLAKYIAAKEAAFKALQVGRDAGISWQHFEVSYAPSGAPQMQLSGPARSLFPKRFACHLSISDTATHALAYVVIEVA